MNLYKYNYIILSVFLFLSITACSDPQMYSFTKTQTKEIDTFQIERVNFYLETSVSMKGYVNTDVIGNYTLKDVIPFLITDLDKDYGINSTLHTISDESRIYKQSKYKFFEQLRKGSLLNGK